MKLKEVVVTIRRAIKVSGDDDRYCYTHCPYRYAMGNHKYHARYSSLKFIFKCSLFSTDLKQVVDTKRQLVDRCNACIEAEKNE